MPNGLKRFPGPRHPNRARIFWRKLQNKEIIVSKPHAGKKPIVLFLIVLLVGIFVIDQGLKKPGIASPILRIDPFTTIWDGRVNGASSTLASYDPSPPSNTLTGMTQVGDYTGECYSGSLITSGTLLAVKIYLSKTGTPSQTFNGQIWSTTGTPGTSGGGRCVRSGNLATSSNTIDSSTITGSQTLFQFDFTGAGQIQLSSGTNYFVQVQVATATSADSLNFVRAGFVGITQTDKNIGGLAQGGIPCSANENTCQMNSYILGAICPAGYSCLNSKTNLNGVIVQTPNATFPAIALSQSPIDLSTGVSKELAFNEQWSGVSGTGPWAWYLTLNKTLPQTAIYIPGNDSEVALFVETFRSGSTYSHYVYIQRTGHQSVIPGSGVVTNPFNNCPPNTIFICGQKANTGTTSFESLILNYTGSVSAPGGANGRSKLCVTATSGATESCEVGGSQQSIITNTGQGVLGNFTLPWLNIQNGPYYLGFWDAAGAQTMNWQNAIGDVNQPNVISLFVPTVSANVPGQIQEGGFFGPLIKALIGLGVWILSNILQYVSFLFTVIVTAFDAVGAFLGIGPIGTQMQRVVAEVATWITNVFAPVIAAALNTVVYIGNFFSVISAVASGYFSFMTGWLSSLAGILGMIITVLQNATSLASYGSSFFIISWWVWGIFSALRSFDEWLKWCKWSYLGTVSIARISFSFGETVWGIILKAKSLLHPLSSGGGTTGSPV